MISCTRVTVAGVSLRVYPRPGRTVASRHRPDGSRREEHVAVWLVVGAGTYVALLLCSPACRTYNVC